MKTGEIILCKGIKLDKGYENVLSYNESSMVTLCRNNQIATTTKYSILDPTIGSIDVLLPYSSCIIANYIAFKNPYYGNKWYFGFVNDVKYVNNNTTTIEYQLDVFSTWYQYMNLGQAFIEREHVDDDTFGKHTLDEGLELGEYIINSCDRMTTKLASGGYVAVVTQLVDGISPTPTDSTYGNVFSGFYYLYFNNTSYLRILVDAYAGKGIGDALINIFTVPSGIISNTNLQTYTIPSWEGSGGDKQLSLYILPSTTTPYEIETNKTINRQTTLDDYTPVNNKMLIYPYTYLYINNNSGSEVIYKWEEFNGTPGFNIDGIFSPGCSIRMYPLNYKQYTDIPYPLRPHLNPKEYCFGITAGKYPNCSWNHDAYTNWLTQNAVNLEGREVIGGAKMISSALPLSGGNIDTAGEQFIGGLTDVLGAVMEKNDKRQFLPNETRGNANSGDICYSTNSINFMYYKMSIKREQASIIDNFFSRYGYKVNEIKTPNILSRTKFNFIKVGGNDEVVYGDIPASDLDKINKIFRKGVTIFHDYTTFGNYTQTNAIVTTNTTTTP